MNYARIIGKVVDRLSTYDGFIYMVRTCRSGNKKVYDDIYVVLNMPFEINTGEAYEFVGRVGVICQKPHIRKPDICIYAEDVFLTKEATAHFNEVHLRGTIVEKIQHYNIPNKTSLLLKPDDDSCDKYKVAAWNRRLTYIERKAVGDSLTLYGELVKYKHKKDTKLHPYTEIAFWYEDNLNKQE